MTAVKNLGLVKAIHIGTAPPNNTKLLWFDDNIGQKIHKAYNFDLSTWMPLTANVGGTATFPFTDETEVDITHTLNKIPTVIVIDSFGNLLIAEVQYDVNNLTSHLTVSFNSETTGIVILN